MEFFDAVQNRRSVRKYTSAIVPPEVIDRAIDAALLAPNSSNMQTWRIFWVRDPKKKAPLVQACLNQGAARTAQELLVFVADPGTWKTSQKYVLEAFGSQPRKEIAYYYRWLIPMTYSWRILAPIKWLIYNATGFFRPIMRRPWSSRDIDEVCIKSTALACENFMLAISAQGFDTCPMEGMDEARIRRILKLGCRARVVMVISVGLRDEKGIWGNQYRIPREIVVKTV